MTASVEANVKTAAKDIEQRGIMRSAEAEDSAAIKSVDQIMEQSERGELYEDVGNLITKLDIFVGIIDEASKVSILLDKLRIADKQLLPGSSVPQCCMASRFGFVQGMHGQTTFSNLF